jgi:hypothetical protein
VLPGNGIRSGLSLEPVFNAADINSGTTVNVAPIPAAAPDMVIDEEQIQDYDDWLGHIIVNSHTRSAAGGLEMLMAERHDQKPAEKGELGVGTVG